MRQYWLKRNVMNGTYEVFEHSLTASHPFEVIHVQESLYTPNKILELQKISESYTPNPSNVFPLIHKPKGK